MNIVVAPQCFKEMHSPFEVAAAISKGIENIIPKATVKEIPMADGGDYTLDVLLNMLSGHINETIVTAADNNYLKAPWGIIGKTVVIEVAKICGLAITPPKQRNPLRTTTFGVGEVIRSALDAGFRDFIIGVGGTATNDGGAGMAQALGARLLNSNGSEIRRGCADLSSLARIDISNIDPRIRQSKFTIACDVLNYLTGKQGASMVYGPQKGAQPMDVEVMEECLVRYSAVIKRDLKIDLEHIPRAGAGGGLAAGCYVFLKGELVQGSNLLIEKISLEKHISNANIVFTGEGKIDTQSLNDKTPIAVARVAKKYNVPVVAIVGAFGNGYEAVFDQGITAVIPLSFLPIKGLPDTKTSLQMITKATEEALHLSLISLSKSP